MIQLLSVEGFTVIFNKAKDEKKTGGASGRHSSKRRIDSDGDEKKVQSVNDGGSGSRKVRFERMPKTYELSWQPRKHSIIEVFTT
ncbi:hypothetical protein K1719_003441 [Acacia pycnantha]|nr:hypothetical protein K1719_003441 [Acacia pycnantha]